MVQQYLIDLTDYILSIQDPILFEKERKRIGKLLRDNLLRDNKLVDKYISINTNDTTTNGGENQ